MKLLAMVCAAAVIATGAAAQNKAESLTGTWNMGLQGDHVIPTALVLSQDGTAVTGTIAMPTQHAGQRVEVKMDGDFVDSVLTLTGTVDHAKEPTRLELRATLTAE